MPPGKPGIYWAQGIDARATQRYPRAPTLRLETGSLSHAGEWAAGEKVHDPPQTLKGTRRASLTAPQPAANPPSQAPGPASERYCHLSPFSRHSAVLEMTDSKASTTILERDPRMRPAPPQPRHPVQGTHPLVPVALNRAVYPRPRGTPRS